MTNTFAHRVCLPILLPLSFLTVSLIAASARAQTCQIYNPIPIPQTNEVSDKLTDKDIPTGDGGFARDYTITLNDKDQVSIDVLSDNFDAIVTLMAADGSTVAENDDGPDGSTNSLLFVRITEGGKYIIRVRAFGETGSGAFKMKVTRLKPVSMNSVNHGSC
ncbi:MAG TPA: peptidase [Cyanobacteria bacterium UBA11149]|nr:peptidase [Cyanobacteria bacterium UBA11367]HBE60073.1 peptidase [Cyanobacteria bacterium UBA11366]HBK64829.1 peptidase [Cyanobacteria bacterium UBA11166]HBR76145.1 peptidase [Cyanobacteria bacterium UBA11159]HBS72498.1 peptidase [Cyanobacteria bacterium UBA11153]HBW87911.1 peptidase [Cyanobacteria bacterium UBA11149]